MRPGTALHPSSPQTDGGAPRSACLPQGFRGEALEAGAEIRLRVQLCIAVHLAGQITHAHRAPRDEANSQFFAHGKHAVSLWTSFHERIFGLNGRNRLNRMSLADRARTRLGETEVQDFTFLDEVLDCTGDILDRHVRIDPMLIVEINMIGPEPLEGCLDDPLDTLRSAVEADRAVNRKTELGGDQNLVADRGEGLAHELLVCVGAVDFGCIEECDTPVVRRAKGSMPCCCLPADRSWR